MPNHESYKNSIWSINGGWKKRTLLGILSVSSSGVCRWTCGMLNARLYPFCMLTIQLPSDIPTGPPPTIRVVLWIKQPTDDSSPGRKQETKYLSAPPASWRTSKFLPPKGRYAHLLPNDPPLISLLYYIRYLLCAINKRVFLSQVFIKCTEIE